jgi:hypothetical protein
LGIRQRPATGEVSEIYGPTRAGRLNARFIS